MKKNMLLVVAGALALAAVAELGGSRSVATGAVPAKAEKFPLSAIRLQGGLLGRQQELNRQYLLSLDPDRLLSRFRERSGLKPKQPAYGGWEDGLAGHILGFYLSGASMTYAATGDQELRRRLEYIIDEFAEIQQHNGCGFALANPRGRQVFDEMRKGDIRVSGGLPSHKTTDHINGVCEPVYTMNKVLLGLEAVWRETGYEKAKQVFLAMSDWFGTEVLDHISDEQVQRMLHCEYGSLPESFADAYRMTGDEKYRRWAKRLVEERMVGPLAAGDGKYLDGFHANCTLAKYTGFESVYRITGDERLHRATVNFWDEVVLRRSWANGGNSAGEAFFPYTDFRKVFGTWGPESCNSVNMLRQTAALFQSEPQAKRMDYYERVLFDHLLATHDPYKALTCYYTPMHPGGYRHYANPYDQMFCCVGTGLEAPGGYGMMVYTHDAGNAALMVNLFAPSTLDWQARGVKVVQRTNFPYEPATTLEIAEVPADGAEFVLRIRHPAWVAEGALAVTVNGVTAEGGSKPGEYRELRRSWRKGDAVKVALPMKFHVEPLPGDGTMFAYFYGPILLAGELGTEDLSIGDFHGHPERTWKRVADPLSLPRPVADGPEQLPAMLEPVPGETLHFRSRGFFPREVTLRPTFEIHFQRYTVYWELLSATAAKELREERERLTQLDRITIDRVRPNRGESEKAHHLEGKDTGSGAGAYGTRPESGWRHALSGGWFSYRMKVNPQAKTLRAYYYGRETGERTFDVLVDGKLVKTETMDHDGPDAFIPHDIPLTPEMIAGKEFITVTFKPHLGNIAGGLFDLRVMK